MIYHTEKRHLYTSLTHGGGLAQVQVLLHHLGIQSNTQAKPAWNSSMGRQKEY